MKVEIALPITLVLPTWKPMEKKHTENPAYDFVKRFIGGRETILWTQKRHTVTTNDPVWFQECCRVVAGLSRAELCLMHVYTTQAYAQITQFLRGASVAELGLIYNIQNEWMSGETKMLDNVRHRNKSGFLSTDVDPHKLQELLGAWRAPRSHKKFKMCWQCYTALRPHFTHKFLQLCKGVAVRNHGGIVFAAQSGLTLTDFQKAIPLMTARDWNRILVGFISDLDKIFVKMPQSLKAFYLYRGEGKAKEGKGAGNPSYTSTSLDQNAALQFAKPTLLRITVPVGSRVLPLLCLSRYAEQEVLLPRNFVR